MPDLDQAEPAEQDEDVKGQAPEELHEEHRPGAAPGRCGPAGRGPGGSRSRSTGPSPGPPPSGWCSRPIRRNFHCAQMVNGSTARRRTGPCPAAAGQEQPAGRRSPPPPRPRRSAPGGGRGARGRRRGRARSRARSSPAERDLALDPSDGGPGREGEHQVGQARAEQGGEERRPSSVPIASAVLVRLGTEMMVTRAEFLMRAMKMLPEGLDDGAHRLGHDHPAQRRREGQPQRPSRLRLADGHRVDPRPDRLGHERARVGGQDDDPGRESGAGRLRLRGGRRTRTAYISTARGVLRTMFT